MDHIICKQYINFVILSYTILTKIIAQGTKQITCKNELSTPPPPPQHNKLDILTQMNRLHIISWVYLLLATIALYFEHKECIGINNGLQYQFS